MLDLRFSWSDLWKCQQMEQQEIKQIRDNDNIFLSRSVRYLLKSVDIGVRLGIIFISIINESIPVFTLYNLSMEYFTLP